MTVVIPEEEGKLVYHYGFKYDIGHAVQHLNTGICAAITALGIDGDKRRVYKLEWRNRANDINQTVVFENEIERVETQEDRSGGGSTPDVPSPSPS